MNTLHLSDLRGLSEDQRAARVREFLDRRNEIPAADLAELDEAISVFVIRYEMSSETMRAKFQDGSLRETAEISQWMMLVKMRDAVAGFRAARR